MCGHESILDRHFLKHPEWKNFPVFARDCVCFCGAPPIFSQALQLCFSLHFLLWQSLQVSQRWQRGAFSGLFLVRTLPWLCMWCFRFPGVCCNFTKPLWTSFIPQPVLPRFGQSVACLKCYATSGSSNQNICLLMFQHCPLVAALAPGKLQSDKSQSSRKPPD